MSAQTVLMLAEQEDGEAVYVSNALTMRGVRVVWFDTAWFSSRASVSARLGCDGWHGEITTPDGAVRLEEVTAVYYRQSQPFTFPGTMSEPERRFATVEARFGFGGLFMSLPACWVSHPARLADAEYRPLQMATAARCGFTTPASILTNHPGDARDFARSGDGAVYKATMHKLISEDDRVKLIYTTPVDPATIDDRVTTTLHLFQANVPKSHDVRVVVTGNGHVHAIAIHTDDPAARQDFRNRYDTLTYEITSVPRDVAHSCHAYLKALGLELGVFDFCVTDDGHGGS
ncbi:MvdC/MvdD family ATP grasp protein [Actinomadura rubrisoli]|uniref:ATP-grasp ribosomal peptide maturase n=1 Tax=Actinomadura rubrisoli TaxID=2530368 RepID=A0A4R5AAJ8_9ACTN|nr:ATP-grasp ribosomal peptide maturase [Actinomadura rubrisoli]TDD69171.1 ATP-grasp ribosomal peptide maturase [Actinomadura rubrisoli]